MSQTVLKPWVQLFGFHLGFLKLDVMIDRDIKLIACSFYTHVGPSYVKSSCAEQHLRTVTVPMSSPAKFLFWSILNQMWNRDIFSSTSIQSNFFCNQWIRPLLAVIKKVDQVILHSGPHTVHFELKWAKLHDQCVKLQLEKLLIYFKV